MKNSKFVFNIEINARIGSFQSEVRQILKLEVAKGCERYVPFDSGVLSRSVEPSIYTDDPYLIYTPPYAAKQYYEYERKSPDVHPDATRFWFEVWKAANGEATIKKIAKAVKF